MSPASLLKIILRFNTFLQHLKKIELEFYSETLAIFMSNPKGVYRGGGQGGQCPSQTCKETRAVTHINERKALLYRLLLHNRNFFMNLCPFFHLIKLKFTLSYQLCLGFMLPCLGFMLPYLGFMLPTMYRVNVTNYVQGSRYQLCLGSCYHIQGSCYQLCLGLMLPTMFMFMLPYLGFMLPTMFRVNVTNYVQVHVIMFWVHVTMLRVHVTNYAYGSCYYTCLGFLLPCLGFMLPTMFRVHVTMFRVHVTNYVQGSCYHVQGSCCHVQGSCN